MMQRTHQEAILLSLRTVVGELLQMTPADIDVATPLLEMGADSLVIAQVVRRIEKQFGLTFTTQQLFEELNTLAALAAYIAAHDALAEAADAPPSDAGRQGHPSGAMVGLAPVTTSAPAMFPQDTVLAASERYVVPDGSALERVISQQIQVMAQQLEVLRGRGRPM